MSSEIAGTVIRDGPFLADRSNMRHRPQLLLATLGAFLAVACASNPDGGCPRAGLDTARRCKRLCVVSPRNAVALSCSCAAECLCWQMTGHSTRKAPSEPPEIRPGQHALEEERD